MRRLVARSPGLSLLATLLLVAGLEAPAAAQTVNPPEAWRSGPSRWSPQLVGGQGVVASDAKQYVIMSFRWDEYLHKEQVSGGPRALEIKTSINERWANDYGDFYFAFAPTESDPYHDSLLFENGPDKRFGMGFAAPGFLPLQETIWVYLEVKGGGGATGEPMGLRTNASHEHSWCAPTPECVYDDYQQQIVRKGQHVTGPYVQFSTNRLYNQGIEQGTAGYSFWPGMRWGAIFKPPGTWPTPFNGNYYLQFNKGSAPISVAWQDVPFNAVQADKFSMDAALRCTEPPQDCIVNFYIWALDAVGNSPESISYGPLSIPPDGRWWICRLDDQHAAGDKTWFNVGGITALRWMIHLDTTNPDKNLAVDFTTLGMNHTIAQDNGDHWPGHDPVPRLPNCSPQS